MSKLRNLIVLLLTIASFSYPLKAQNKMNSKDALSPREQRMISIASLTAKGNLSGLKAELNLALGSGLTVNQIKEVIIHLYAYCGFPRSIRGLQSFMEVLNERKTKGINDSLGADATAIHEEGSKYERGRKILEKLMGSPQSGAKTGYSAFAPTIDVFLKEHLFCDIFERDVLTYPERELVTISVLSTLGGVETLLASHMKICLNVGLTPDKLQQFVTIIQTTAGKEEAKSSGEILDALLKTKSN